MTTDNTEPRYLRIEEVAAELGVHVQTAQRYFRTGGLPGRKIGKTWTTTREALDAWVASGNKQPDAPTGDVHMHVTPDVPNGGTLPPLETKDHRL